MYRYRNKKTSAVIKTNNKVIGKNWELVEDTDTQLPDGDPFEDDAFEDENHDDATDEEEPEQTEVAEEAPAEKPKTSSRGKK